MNFLRVVQQIDNFTYFFRRYSHGVRIICELHDLNSCFSRIICLHILCNKLTTYRNRATHLPVGTQASTSWPIVHLC